MIKTTVLILLVVTNLQSAASAPGVTQSFAYPVSGRPVTPEGITPADVLSRVELLASELDLIRYEMGQPKLMGADLRVSDILPREAIFQALTLYVKSNQLNLEYTGRRKKFPRFVLPSIVLPYHVWLIVNNAYQSLREVRLGLGIDNTTGEEAQSSDVTPTDVFHEIVRANRQLNNLVQRKPESVNVLNHVMVATGFTVRLLQLFPEADVEVGVPDFERGKQPADVYDLLLETYSKVNSIVRRSGIPVLKLKEVGPQKDSGAPLSPSDVYDVAVLIVSELSYLHSRVYEGELPSPPRASGIKLPSQVHQRAGVLLRLLGQLEAQVAEDPQWMENHRPYGATPPTRWSANTSNGRSPSNGVKGMHGRRAFDPQGLKGAIGARAHDQARGVPVAAPPGLGGSNTPQAARRGPLAETLPVVLRNPITYRNTDALFEVESWNR